MRILSLFVACLASAALAEPEATRTYGAASNDLILVRGTTDIALFEPVLRAFARTRPELGIVYEQWGSNALYAATEAECAATAAQADLVVSSSIDQQVKLANDGCARAHRSAGTASLPAVANWRDEVFGITREPAVMVYDRRVFTPGTEPRSRFDLIDLLRRDDGRLRGRVATYDIETSGLGYLFAFADAQQATTFGALLEALGRGGAVTSCCSSGIIDDVAQGRTAIAYNVLGSYALARAAQDANLAVVAPSDYTLVLSRAALIPRHATGADAAGALIDFMLSEPGRAVLRRSYLIVEATDPGAGILQLPETDATGLRPIALSPALLVGLDQHKRRSFITRWRATFPDARP